ncbi:hypothetical protein ACVDG8_014755 [Mesorhizobium sp. ORM8.1]
MLISQNRRCHPAAGQPVGDRKWDRRKVDFAIRVMFPSRGIREVNSANLSLCDISEGGASINVGSLKGIPDFFYIQFGDENSELVGCYVVGRSGFRIHCQFMYERSSAEIEEIIAANEMGRLLDSLFDAPKEVLVMDEFLDLLDTATR